MNETKEVLGWLVVFYIIVIGVCTLVAVYGGGLPFLWSLKEIGKILAFPFCISAVSIITVYVAHRVSK